MSSNAEAPGLTPLLTPQEVAALLKVAPRRVVTMAFLGLLPGIRISPRCLRFNRFDIEACIDSINAARQTG